MNFNEVISIWISGRPETTEQKYRQLTERLNKVSIKAFNVGLLDLKTPQLEALLRGANKGLSNRTQSNRLWILKGFYRTAMQLGVRSDNPATPLRAPRYEDKLAQRLIRHEQVAAILAAAKSERDKMLIQLLYGAGLRISEALHLTRKDLLGNGQISVFGKGEKTDIVQIRPELEKKLFEFARFTGRIFPISRRAAYDAIKKVAAAAGLPDVSPHWFRHAHATEALRHGASLPVVKASLRHSNISTTMKYAHVVDGDGAALYLPPLGE